MYSYMSQFFGGGLDPTWPHAILIAGSIIGGALVGLGVILEAPKILSVPVAAVFVGVVIEAACTLLLFGFDEGISSAQQSKIAALTADVGIANDAAKNALDSEKQTAKRAEDAENLASKTLQENIELRDKMADRSVSSAGRAIIRERLKGDHQDVTIVVSGMREPQVYAGSIGNSLKAAGYNVLVDPWQHGIPPDTGIVFCENQKDDLKIYEALRLAHVVTKLFGPADHRPDFCDKGGIEAPIEDIIDRLSAGILTPQSVGRLIPHGTLAKWHGPRIYVGQKPE